MRPPRCPDCGVELILRRWYLSHHAVLYCRYCLEMKVGAFVRQAETSSPCKVMFLYHVPGDSKYLWIRFKCECGWEDKNWHASNSAPHLARRVNAHFLFHNAE